LADRTVLNRGDSFMKKFIILSAFLLLYILMNGCAIVHHYGPYYGKVVDAETKEPLEGAAVLAVYYTEQHSPAGSVSHYVDAQETITDNNGEFKIPSNPVTTFRPLQSFKPWAWFTIFKAGYGCYPKHKGVKPMFVPNGTLPADEYVSIELSRLKTIQERIESTHCSPPSYMPYLKAKKMIDLVNEENKSLGLGVEKYK
jgi:hypothetical protein